MHEKTLSDFVKEKSQEAAANLIGWVQGSVSKALKKERDIRLVFTEEGNFSHYYEVKIVKKTAA